MKAVVDSDKRGSQDGMQGKVIMIIITKGQEFVSDGELRREDEFGTCLQTYS